MTRVRVEPRSCNQGRRENDAFALSATLRKKLDCLAYCFNHKMLALKFISEI